MFLSLLAVTVVAAIHDARAADEPRYVLALSWQPAFCETKPGRPECRTQNGARYDATHFSLHGLWPQPRTNTYCNVDEVAAALDRRGRWKSLPRVQLEPATRQDLERIMPGTRSQLDRHEWTKHGTCYTQSPETYFGDAIRLTQAVNTSAVRVLFSGAVGRTLTATRIREAFDATFGAGTGARVKVSCVNDGQRRLIDEITIGLAGERLDSTDIGALILASPPTSPGCPSGIVDPVGLQ